MRRRLAAALLGCLLFLSLSACGEKELEEGPTMTVYYISTNAYEDGVPFLQPLSVPVGSGVDLIHTALRSLEETPLQPGLASAFVKGTRIYSYTLEEGTIRVDLSPAYIGLTDLEQTAVKACLTLTLCALEEIDSVDICIEGSPVAEGLEPTLLMIDNNENSEPEKRLLLYYPDSLGRYLLPAYRVLTVQQNRLLAAYVVEELLEPEPGEGRRSPLPEGTRVLSVEQKNGLCTVNLSREFIDGRSSTAAGQRICVYAVVNSLTRLDGIERVRFHVEGNDTASYEYIDLGSVFSSFPDLILEQEAAYRENATLYLGLRGSSQVVAVPICAPLDTSVSREESLVTYVLSHPSVSGYTRLVPLGVTIRSIETVNRVCTLDLSDAFFASGQSSNARRAAQSLASTLLDTRRIDAVNILVEGEPFMMNIRERIENVVN